MTKHTTPATRPINRPESGVTDPQAGVMQAKPATPPVHAPSTVGRPFWIHSIAIQPNKPVAPAI